MKFRNTLVAATMLALPVAANAQSPLSGFYIGAGAGANIMHYESSELSRQGFPGHIGGHLKTRVGPAANLTFGYQLPFGLRAEIEGSYRYNTFSGGGAGGQEQKYGAMFNVLYDVVGLTTAFQPYVGLGAGYQWTQERNLYVPGAGLGGVARAGTSDYGRPAYQGILGGAFPIASVPGLALTADYRFMGLVGARKYGATATTGLVNTPATIRLRDDFNHTLLVGVRYAFGKTAPAPVAPVAAPVPASPVSRSYLVFFDWDKSVLTERARQIVAEAAANSTKVQFTQIEVNGYTDTSGTPRYNQGLSMRRAQSVAAELVKDGVPREAIAIHGFGETHLLVPTGANVREPQNRRVEIIIR